jgi:hypothetical protein
MDQGRVALYVEEWGEHLNQADWLPGLVEQLFLNQEKWIFKSGALFVLFDDSFTSSSPSLTASGMLKSHNPCKS